MTTRTLNIPWGWLLAVLMLCILQGWLLTLSSALVAMVFWFGSLFVARTIALSKPKIVATFIWILWSVAIAWTVAGTVADAWHGAVVWATAIAVALAMFLAITLAWAWLLCIFIVGRELRRALSSAETFLILVLNSWFGLGIGCFAALLSCPAGRTCLGQF